MILRFRLYVKEYLIEGMREHTEGRIDMEQHPVIQRLYRRFSSEWRKRLLDEVNLQAD
jgi:hypothetical protein